MTQREKIEEMLGDFIKNWHEIGDHVKDPSAYAQAITQIETLITEAFKHGQRVGQYQVADKMYGIIPTIWLFKDSTDLTLLKMNVERTDDLLKECEKYLNHNAKAYKAYLPTLQASLKGKS